MVALILVEQNLKYTTKPFTYLVPLKYQDEIKIGMRVTVPFGKKLLSGFVLKLAPELKETPEYKLKEIMNLIDKKPILNEELILLGKTIKNQTLSPLITVYQAMLPSFLKAKIKTGDNRAQFKRITLKVEKSVVKEYINNNKRATAQITILNKLLTTKYLNKNELSTSAVNSLNEKKLIKIVAEDKEKVPTSLINNNLNKKITLTEEQEEAIKKVNIKKHHVYLLHGITGSGKTEVYIRIIKNVLKENKTAIVLVPEISLTPIMVAIFKNIFKDQVAVLHSALTELEKYTEWKRINEGKAKVVVGARSAIFAPLSNLGIIIIDEEHSTTYKQDITPRYHARDVAINRGTYHDCPVVLGSATPALESYARAKKGNYELLSLTKRPKQSVLPEVRTIDMKDEIIRGNRAILSDELKVNIQKRLEKKEQVMLLLNRRGYNTLLTCKDCGNSIKCPHCEVTLTYHKKTNFLRCHYCGYATSVPEKCPTCNSKELSNKGYGTELLEEKIKEQFKTARVVRMDFDTTSKRGSHEKIIDDFRNYKYDILIGTQMIAKGHDFAKVSLVGILNSDQLLNIPDFRSAERTFSLITQASGRAGRSDIKGEVIIQSFNPDHYSIKMAIDHDYIGFYNQEMKIRKKLNYPPYSYLALIKVVGKDINEVKAQSNKIANHLNNKLSKETVILGPSPAAIMKLKNNFYFHIIIKYKSLKEIVKEITIINKYYLTNNKVSFYVDFNPLSI